MPLADDILAIAIKRATAAAKSTVAGAVDGLSFKGAVDYVADLPVSATLGDLYLVRYSGSSGSNPLRAKYVYDGEDWILYANTVADDGLGIIIN